MDLLLLLMVLIWGSNYSVIKSALAEIPPVAFNGLRLAVASALFLAAIASHLRRAWSLLKARDFWAIALIGQTAYQLLFIAGIARTSVANSALIIGCTPVFIALMTGFLRHETIAPVRWIGIATSAVGIYLVVGRGAAVTGESLAGDLLMMGSVLCWSIATIVSRGLLARESPLVVTASSMTLGTVCYLPFAWPELHALRWSGVSAYAWVALVSSAALALCVAYVIWFSAIQRLGNTRTAVYSNLIPVVAMVVASVFFGEQIGWLKAAGGAVVLLGVALTRL